MHASLPITGAVVVLLLTGCAASSTAASAPVPAESSGAASVGQSIGSRSAIAPVSSRPASSAPASAGRVVPKQPGPLAVRADGRLVISDDALNEILSRAPDGGYTVVAGDGMAGFSGDGGPATAAQLNHPAGLAIATDGTLYIADEMNSRVRAVGPDGTIRTVFQGAADVDDVKVAADGAVYAATTDGIVEIRPALKTIASDAQLSGYDPGFGKEAGCYPDAIAFDATGDSYVSCSQTKSLLERSAAGAITFRGEFRPHDAVAALIETSSGEIVGCNGDQLLLESGPSPQPLMSFEADLPGIGPFWPQGIAAASNGTLYLSQDGVSGIGPAAIISLDTIHRVTTLWTQSS